MKNVRILLLTSMVLLNSACSLRTASAIEDRDIPAPPVRTDGTLVSVSIKVECANVCALSGLPDGWSTTIDPKSEDYIVTLRPGNAMNSSQDLANSNTRFLIGGRGPWSDCVGVSSRVVSKVGGNDMTECFEWSLPSGAGWKPGSCR